jgi:hypothetical protein
MAGKKLCFVVGEIGATKTPERTIAMWLMNEIVQPVLEADYPDFEARHVEMVLEQEHINKEILDNLTHAELVIANLSAATPLTLYQVGIRHATGLPIILMASTRDRPLFDLPEFRYIAFRPKGGVAHVRAALKEEIGRVLAEASISVPKFSAPSSRKSKVELAKRIETVADALASLRINSLSDPVQELHKISQHIREFSDDAPALRDLSGRALPILTNLFDVLGTQQGAQVIVSGAIAGILGAGGWPSAVIYGLTLGAWMGKDAFMAALDKLPKSRNSNHETEMDKFYGNDSA